jgi:hypothetical protein
MLTVTTHHPIVKGPSVIPHLARRPPGSWAVAATSDVPRILHHGTYLVYLVVAVPIAIALVIVIVVWRSARRDRARAALAEQLANPEPRERRRVLDGVDDEVLARNSATLFELLNREQDPDVLDALAAAIARSRWEPTDDRNLIELRRWVAGSHTRTTASTTVEPVAAVAGMPPAPVEPDAGVPIAVATDAAAVPGDDVHIDDDVADDDHWSADPPASDDDADAADVAVSVDGSTERSEAPARDTDSVDELADFIPRVRALIGGGVERVELALITGTVLKTWSATDPNGTGGATVEEHAPTS